MPTISMSFCANCDYMWVRKDMRTIIFQAVNLQTAGDAPGTISTTVREIVMTSSYHASESVTTIHFYQTILKKVRDKSTVSLSRICNNYKLSWWWQVNVCNDTKLLSLCNWTSIKKIFKYQYPITCNVVAKATLSRVELLVTMKQAVASYHLHPIKCEQHCKTMDFT